MSRFTSKLVKMTKEVLGKFDDYSVLLKVREV